MLRRQGEPAPIARGSEQLRLLEDGLLPEGEEPLHPRRQQFSRASPGVFCRAGTALDRPSPLALRVLPRLPAPVARGPRLCYRLRQGGVRGLLDLIGGQGTQLEIDPQHAELLLDLAYDEVRVGGQLRGQAIDEPEPAVAACEALTGERRRRRDGRGVGQSIEARVPLDELLRVRNAHLVVAPPGSNARTEQAPAEALAQDGRDAYVELEGVRVREARGPQLLLPRGLLGLHRPSLGTGFSPRPREYQRLEHGDCLASGQIAQQQGDGLAEAVGLSYQSLQLL